MESVVLYKFIPYIIYGMAIVFSLGGGALVYAGLSNSTERLQTRLRMRSTLNKGRALVQESASKSAAEDWLKKAGNPLGLTSLTYHIIFIVGAVILLGNYVFIPFIMTGEFSIIAFAVIFIGFLFFLPSMPYSLFVFFMKRLVDFQQAKKNAEVFMLYDLLINELQMMKVSRINSYNLIKDLLPYFSTIQPFLAKTLTEWSSNIGPDAALENLGKKLGTREGRSLVSVLKSLDRVDRVTAITSLKGMQEMFTRAQIENNRRKRKVTTDLLGIPVKVTHFLIIINFIVVVVIMVSNVLSSSH
ncbi:hypothetical protein [Rossellomorea marisflavi]|uniref:hypothetical protein n=1 Tax=Rossellomorea marisflavi TaxID=189381 RepID=UPI00201DBED0|nr:hypothetical protein [Rossellomorea marisflavi]